MARVGMRDQRGQTSAEYLGVWVLVALTVGALMAMNPGVGQVIGDGLRAIVCRIAGGDCGGPDVDSANPSFRRSRARGHDRATRSVWT